MKDVSPALLRANVRLHGSVDEKMLGSFLEQLEAALEGDGDVVVELTTSGGDADLARRIAEEIRLARDHQGRQPRFIGKTMVYSSGVTIMTSFARADRYLTQGCYLLVHERRLDKEIKVSGPLKSNVQVLREALAQLEIGIALEQRGFAALAEGSNMSAEEIEERAHSNWYVSAEEALARGLIAGVI